MKPSDHTLVCFALKEEAGAFKKYAAGRTDVHILITGMGRNNAEGSIIGALQVHSPRVVLTCGFAGGLNPDFKIGDVVFEIPAGGSRENKSSSETQLSPPPVVSCENLVAAGAAPAKFYCATRIATTAAEKRELRRVTGADAVEMESGVIQRICRERGISCATVRAISDPANEDLPLDFNALANPDLSLNYGKLAWAIAKSPGKIPALLRLQRHSRFAAERLADVLRQVLTQCGR